MTTDATGVLVIIPTYDERENIERIVERVPVAILHFRPTPAAFALAVKARAATREA